MVQSAFTLTNTTAYQRMINASAKGAVTLASGSYVFEAMIYASGLSATIGNIGFDLKGAGTFAFGGVRLLYEINGLDSTAAGPSTKSGIFSALTYVVAPSVTATTATNTLISIRGTFEGTGGTLIPSVSLQTGIGTAQMNAGSYYLLRRVAAARAATAGSWS
jgi:hypothetical protein